MMVENLYSEFDSNVIITSKNGKTFNENLINLKKLKQINGINSISKAVEEIVILKHEKKWINAKLYGVESSFLQMSKIAKHLISGKAILTKNNDNFGLIGASLLDRLGGFIGENEDYENLTIYSPKRNTKITNLSNPFRINSIKLSGRINYNKEVNEEALIVPISFAKQMLNYTSDLSAIYVNLNSISDLEYLKEQIQKNVGKNFEVKTFKEKNKLIYQTSKSEKLIVLIILVFVFILAVFNLVSSLTMMYIEKKDNLKTLNSFGFDHSSVFKTFFYQGCLISLKGILFGMVLGLLIVSIQLIGKIVLLPNSNNQAFPIKLTFTDSLLVFGIVTIISILASYLTVLFLIKHHNKHAL
jgi:lipoprotein-releasing system permease protein